MVRLHLNGNEIKNYSDWCIWKNDEDSKEYLTVTYQSGKKITQLRENWKIEPCYKIEGDLLFNVKYKSFHRIESALSVGDKYLIVNYMNNKKEYIMKHNNYEVMMSTDIKSNEILKYFRDVASERADHATSESIINAENIKMQFDKIVAYKGTALNSYLTKKVVNRVKLKHLIFPFGINESQFKAVTRAFESQISVIEGPPGTGKTQTILNIIANIIVNGKTCAIVSNNNSAVENVYEKLEKVNLDFLIAKLGKNRIKFFASMKYQKPEKCEHVNIESIDLVLTTLQKYLKVKNECAQITSEIGEIEIEKKYLQKWYDEASFEDTNINMKRMSSTRTIELLTYLRALSDNSLTFLNRVKLFVKYGIFKSDFLVSCDQRLSYIFKLQLLFYEINLNEKKIKRDKLEKTLANINYDSVIDDLKKKSFNYLNNYISSNMPLKLDRFTEKNYRNCFGKFTKAFPILGCSTHSLLNSIADGAMLDYVIIDEASMQDLVPGILCLSCAQNVVIVGDRKQLPHIAQSSEQVCPDELYNCVNYSLLDSVCEVFGDNIPRTLLKEHYRCHPRIIQYCNKQFYDNQLISMTKDSGEEALSLVETALGNHMRGNANLREIESIKITHDVAGYLETNVGFIAPYNAQINLAKKALSIDLKIDTIHKFQGRECDEIIFSTVLDKKCSSKYQMNFVDNAFLVNVAVSRAIHKFTLVTGKNVFIDNNKYIASLIRYIKYYANAGQIFDSPVISAFDLLYNEYDKSLDKLSLKLRKEDSVYKSEQIVAVLLDEILEDEEFNSLIVHKQIHLKQLVKLLDGVFTERETEFINNGASCDFVVYYRLGKLPIAVIEVDGQYHGLPEQQERDQVKNQILKKAGISLLRLPTVCSEVKTKLITHLRNRM